MRVEALTIKQPYASWIASGSKSIELRTRKTHYKGLLIICSALDYDKNMLTKKQAKGLPRGKALAVCRLYHCRKMREYDTDSAMVPDFNPKLYSWCLWLEMKLEGFEFPVKGKQGFFNIEVPADTVKKIGERFLETGCRNYPAACAY